ncbi:unnamed protein product [Cyclocybe aegerita]|uniref:Uncharacterized protein n=1 Tax=Cyclocybe aegerita TaxID=1973307 RepID=A0A8S0Y0D7_CYCAE|nr:unnamed protein product [Cyclocybe aegerita]
MIFPIELLDHMLAYVEEDPDATTTLKNFSYANHLTCHLAQKRLFRDLLLVYSGYEDGPYHICEQISPPSHVQRFLLLAEESPHLLQHIQTLRISWPSWTTTGIERDMHETHPRTIVLISLLKNLKKVTFVDESMPHRWSNDQPSVFWNGLDTGLQSAFAQGFRFTNVVELNFASITDMPPCVLAESLPLSRPSPLLPLTSSSTRSHVR